MSLQIDYEIAQHEAFSVEARLFVEMGHRKAARLFESLSDLCFDKAAIFREVEEILVSQLLAGAQLWEESHRQCGFKDDLQYEVERYELYSTYAYSFQEMGSIDEANLFRILSDLCYEKATLLVEVATLLRSRC